MLVIGLTGSIGMGKSTTAMLFRQKGIPVHDADAAVHGLYAGKAVAPVEAAFPGVVVEGVIDRARLGARVLGQPAEMARLEAIVHPLVKAEEVTFLEKARRDGQRHVVLDIPLLLESGANNRVDLVLVVTAPSDVQKARVMARPGMTEEKMAAIMARQIPDAQKRRSAHALIDTSFGLSAAANSVDAFLRAVVGIQGRNLVDFSHA